METDDTGEDVPHSSGWPWRQRNKEEHKEMDLNFIFVFKNSRNELARPVMGTIFLVYIHTCM